MHQKLKMKYATHSRATGGPWLAHGRPTKKHIKKTLYARQVRTGFFLYNPSGPSVGRRALHFFYL